MSLMPEIEEAFKKALKTQDKMRLSALRLLRTALKNKEIERRAKLEDQEIISVIKGLIRQGREAALEFEKGGRPELAEKEKAEIEFISVFLPPQAELSEVEAAIAGIIEEQKASGMKDMGKVMKAAMLLFGGRADGQTIQTVVKQHLSSPTGK
ncbi:MAG: GatB/YqeY domain-containing protein [Thermodesulfobacteriota bacterium]